MQQNLYKNCWLNIKITKGLILVNVFKSIEALKIYFMKKLMRVQMAKIFGISFLIAGSISMMACGNGGSDADHTEHVDTIENADGMAQSLILEGAYKGTLPCADCEGIETTIVFKEDNSYTLDAKYLGRDGAPVQYEGQYAIDGDVVTLQGITDSPAKYQLDGDDLVQLDMDGKKIESTGNFNYTLEKQ